MKSPTRPLGRPTLPPARKLQPRKIGLLEADWEALEAERERTGEPVAAQIRRAVQAMLDVR